MPLGKPHPLPVGQTSEVIASNFGSWFKKAFRILLLARSVLVHVADSLITALSSWSSLPLSNVAGSYSMLNSHFPITWNATMENNNTTVDRGLEGKVRLKLVTIITIAGTTLLSASLATMRITIYCIIKILSQMLCSVLPVFCYVYAPIM